MWPISLTVMAAARTVAKDEATESCGPKPYSPDIAFMIEFNVMMINWTRCSPAGGLGASAAWKRRGPHKRLGAFFKPQTVTLSVQKTRLYSRTLYMFTILHILGASGMEVVGNSVGAE